MVRNEHHHRAAIDLRQQGFSYGEILRHIPVAKSTLSLWLRSVGLSKRTRHVLSEKKRLAGLRGGAARHNQRTALVQKVFDACKQDIQHITSRELLLMGVMLYWAEGAKEKDAYPGSGIRFANSDARMIRLFLVWLMKSARISQKEIFFSLYIHSNQKDDIGRHRRYWSKETGFDVSHFERVYYKNHNPKTNRSNIGDSYHGVLNIMVRSSSLLLRKIAGWVTAIDEIDWGVV